ncbi:uncharacterized protein M421DRAFT_74369 [Didymella exigua CBS 183.55]|uniref:DNA endonuclease activator Ctp1 C-terminal domain-containing protein n=1 Tax=Didymella exigua CBS 183.55 TaxID=1150837 RepID=A0A6A5R6N8_9PLEO|nr:uncharacterized protein M421DRAFT_74369 [Didymella exigua CBS 183.55]KAF1923795.1 hypothetical protein M421DRAFT_74369 [Didymella exigua CBS 183.55]
MADFTVWVEKNRGLWSRVYDEVIAPDCEKEWKKRDENQHLLFNHINEQIVRNAKIMEENKRLENELRQRAESVAPSTALKDTATDVPEEQHRGLAEKYEELSKKYQDLSQKIKYLERKNNAVMQKNRDMKESVRAWQQYADRVKPKQRRKAAATADETPSRLLAVPHSDEASPHMPSSPGSASTTQTPLQYAARGRSSPAPGIILADAEAEAAELPHEGEDLSTSASVTPRVPPAASFHGHEGATHDLPSLNTRLNRTCRSHVEADAVPSSSQTTVDEVADQANRRTQIVNDEDDWPQVVSERSLKRKRGQQSRLEVYTGRSSDGTPAKPHRIKDEPVSSPPPGTHILTRTETIDLDDATPHGAEAVRALQRKPSFHSNTTGTILHQRSGSAPFSQAARHEELQKEHMERDQMSNVRAKLQMAADELRALSEPTGPHVADQHILQPLDPNTVAQTTERNSNKRTKQAANRRLEHGILAESGEAPPPVDENELRLPPSAARARLQRMRAMKDPQTPTNRLQRTTTTSSPLVKPEQTQSPPKSALRAVPTPSGPGGSRRSAVNARSDQRSEIIPDDRPVWSMRAPDKRPAPRRSNPSPPVGQSRLRDKPVQELKAHDFKPNPAYNNGYTYAFSETVRKRGDRLCLPGCTNEQCCGSHFRRLAEALGPLPTADEEALLEEYLGDAYNTIISTQMSSDERAELVLQARTKKMAKDSGKHREAYERRRTPPGFWRVDFPSTQEREIDRGRAKELEVKAVQDRWLEAHKTGGRWMFRDE